MDNLTELQFPPRVLNRVFGKRFRLDDENAGAFGTCVRAKLQAWSNARDQGYTNELARNVASLFAGESRAEYMKAMGLTSIHKVARRRTEAYGALRWVLNGCRRHLTDLTSLEIPDSMTSDEFARFFGFRDAASCSLLRCTLGAVRSGDLAGFGAGAEKLPLPQFVSAIAVYDVLDEKPSWDELAEGVFALRFRQGLTQAVVADRLGVSRQTVIARQKAICQELGVMGVGVILRWPRRVVEAWREWYVASDDG